MASRKPVHADRDVNVRLLFLKLPDPNLVSSGGRCVFVNEARGIAGFELVTAIKHINPTRFQGA
ncbi:hypothetical protein D3C85_1586380 [compost metagenome]